MSDNSTLLAALLGAIVGGVIGFLSAYLVERQRFSREDEEKLFEKVYGKLYPMLLKAKMRGDEYDDFEPQWPGKFDLSPPEVVRIEGILARYYHIVPKQIHALWAEAKHKGPSIQGPGEVEADNVLYPFDLEKMFEAIKKEIQKRGE